MGNRSTYLSAYRPEMDGLRSIACLIVLVTHAIVFNNGEYYPYLRGISKIGVWLFFVLSAFLLTLRLLGNPFGVRPVIHYSVARFLRIYPVFIAGVVFYLYAGMLNVNTWNDVAAVLVFKKVVGHLWTIPAEIVFYCVLPFIVWLMLIVKSGFGTTGALFLLGVGMICATTVWPPNQTPENTANTGWYVIVFGSGIAAAFVCRGFESPGSKMLGTIAASCTIGILAIILAYKLGMVGDWKAGLVNKHFVFGIFWAGVTYVVYTGGTFWSRILANPVLVQIGEASFSIYVFHVAIAVWLSKVPFPFGAGLTIIVSILVGRIGFLFLEMPTYSLRIPAARIVDRLINWITLPK